MGGVAAFLPGDCRSEPCQSRGTVDRAANTVRVDVALLQQSQGMQKVPAAPPEICPCPEHTSEGAAGRATSDRRQEDSGPQRPLAAPRLPSGSLKRRCSLDAIFVQSPRHMVSPAPGTPDIAPTPVDEGKVFRGDSQRSLASVDLRGSPGAASASTAASPSPKRSPPSAGSLPMPRWGRGLKHRSSPAAVTSAQCRRRPTYEGDDVDTNVQEARLLLARMLTPETQLAKASPKSRRRPGQCSHQLYIGNT